MGLVRDIIVNVRTVLNQAAATRVQMQMNAMQNAINTGATQNTQKLGILNNTINSIARSLLRATAVAIAFFSVRAVERFVATSVKEFAEFDKALTDSISLLGKAGLAIKQQMGEAVKFVARDLNLDFVQVAESIQHLVSAGYDAAQTMKLLPVVATFAKAGNVDLKKSVDYLSDSLFALGINTKDPVLLMQRMTKVSDTLSKANIISNGTIEDFAAALQNRAAQSMRLFNIPLSEGVALLAAYAQQGKKGAEAGTYFDIFLRDATRAAIKNKDAFKAYGIEVYDAGGKLRPLADIVESYSNALSALSPKQQTAALMQLGMTFRSVQATKALLGTENQVRAYTAALENVDGTTREIADVRMSSFSEVMGKVGKSVKAARMEIGEAMVPALLAAAKEIGNEDHGFVGTLKDSAKWIKKNSDELSEFLINVVDVVNAIIRLTELLAKPIVVAFNVISNPAGAWEKLTEGATGRQGGTLFSKIWRNLTGGRLGPVEGLKSPEFDPNAPVKPVLPPDKPLPPKPSNRRTTPPPDVPSQATLNKQRELMEQLNAELAKLSETKADDALTKITKLEDGFKRAFGHLTPENVKAFAELRRAAEQLMKLDTHKLEFEGFDKAVPTPQNLDSFRTWLFDLRTERDGLEKGSKLWQEYTDLINKATDAYDEMAKKVDEVFGTAKNKHGRRENKQFIKWFEEWAETGEVVIGGLKVRFADLQETGVNAAYGIAGAFQDAFALIFDGAATLGRFIEKVARGMAAALLGGIAQYASKKVGENVAEGFENIAKAHAAAALAIFDPAAAWAAIEYGHAATQNFVAAGKWAVVAGAAGAAQSAVAGGGRGGQSGGIPSGASDVGGRLSENKQGGNIYITVSGVNPNDPTHQRIIWDTAREYQERVGGDLYLNGKKQ